MEYVKLWKWKIKDAISIYNWKENRETKTNERKLKMVLGINKKKKFKFIIPVILSKNYTILSIVHYSSVTY